MFARVVDVSRMTEDEKQDCAREVLVPLTVYLLSRNPKTLPAVFDKLQRRTLRFFLDWIAAEPDAFTREAAKQLFDASVVYCDPSLFVTTVVPRLEATKLSVSAVQAIVDELQERRVAKRFVYPKGYKACKLSEVATVLQERLKRLANAQFQRSAGSALVPPAARSKRKLSTDHTDQVDCVTPQKRRLVVINDPDYQDILDLPY
ncbi:uncharacterized protein PHACADRAFT_206248 [Phanerochaete carnosa HHB-10118-sp]|uniref:Uncharacterized protein n=1 Tax=Phanerochaete carnosa (strain HHB-10118-sp) TaxID=650164 RepID=K5WLH6_PHACS|nr:uncharacterized protein PHACADRAFT_206248 [Phanerochaete carnosa HHB-10118-sp]EKM60039.1 hypothetical protein PHACADRAFT_206248 [Phanerochaete carnosa HHB-10118-sp]